MQRRRRHVRPEGAVRQRRLRGPGAQVAAARISETNKLTYKVQKEMLQERHNQHEERVDGILQLKASS